MLTWMNTSGGHDLWSPPVTLPSNPLERGPHSHRCPHPRWPQSLVLTLKPRADLRVGHLENGSWGHGVPGWEPRHIPTTSLTIFSTLSKLFRFGFLIYKIETSLLLLRED